MTSYLDHVYSSDNIFHIENEIILMMLSVSLVKWSGVAGADVAWTMTRACLQAR